MVKDENEQKGIKKMRLYASRMTTTNQIVPFEEEETKQGKSSTKYVREQLGEGLWHAKSPTRAKYGA